MKGFLYAFAVIFCIGLGIAFAWVACFASEWMYVILGMLFFGAIYTNKEI